MVTRRAALADVMVVLGCSVAYVVAGLAGVRIGWIVPVVAVVLLSYGWFVLRLRGDTWRDYGVRGDNLLPAGKLLGAWTLIAAVAIIGWAAMRETPLWRAELGGMLPLYPVWGLIQQFIFQGLLHRRLVRLLGGRLLPLVITALAFGLVHVDDWRVAALTTIAGLGWSYCYQREPNVWLLGLSHGVLGALVYPLVLGENPLDRLF